MIRFYRFILAIPSEREIETEEQIVSEFYVCRFDCELAFAEGDAWLE